MVKFLSFYLRLSLSFIAAMIIGCSSPNKYKIINFNIPEESSIDLDISDISDSIEYIALETNPESLIVLIQGLIYFENKFYVLDFQGKVLVFDKLGKFLFKIGAKGEGPGEFNNLSSFTIDKKAKELYLAAGNRLIKYSLSNQYIEEKKFPFYIDYVHWFDNYVYIIAGEDGKKVGNQFVNQRSLFKIKSNFNILGVSPILNISLDYQLGATFPFKNYISLIGSDKYIYVPSLINEKVVRDTVFSFENDKLIPSIKLNFPKPHFDNNENKLTYIKNIVVSKNYILCEYDYEGEIFQYISKRNEDNSFKFKNGISIGNDENVILRPLDAENDLFYFVKISYYDQESSEEPNPIVGIVKL